MERLPCCSIFTPLSCKPSHFPPSLDFCHCGCFCSTMKPSISVGGFPTHGKKGNNACKSFTPLSVWFPAECEECLSFGIQHQEQSIYSSAHNDQDQSSRFAKVWVQPDDGECARSLLGHLRALADSSNTWGCQGFGAWHHAKYVS